MHDIPEWIPGEVSSGKIGQVMFGEVLKGKGKWGKQEKLR